MQELFAQARTNLRPLLDSGVVTRVQCGLIGWRGENLHPMVSVFVSGDESSVRAHAAEIEKLLDPLEVLISVGPDRID